MCVCVCKCGEDVHEKRTKMNLDLRLFPVFPELDWIRHFYLFYLNFFYITHDQNELSFTKKKLNFNTQKLNFIT